MSLKSLIQRLLDSRTTPEEAGHSAMPINIANATNLTMDVGAEGSYTAPADGYLSLMVEPGGNINLWGQILPISSFPIQNVQGKLFVPMAKGMEVRYYINGTVSLAKFLKTIGGGYNGFVRRALSCLKPSFNFSPRSFCKANIPTLLINADQVQVHKARQSQETARRISWLHSQVGLSLRLAQTVRQTTHGLGLKTPPEELHTSPMQFANTKRLLSQCKKEMFLLLTSALITRTKAPFCLSPLKQQNNLGTGGVTC